MDYNGLFAILGDAVIDFMRLKPQPYQTMALTSQEHFWRVPTWKRSMTFVFLVRYLLAYKSQSQWRKFCIEDLKLNTRCFKRWEENETAICIKSPQFNKFPERLRESPSVVKRRFATTSQFDSSSDSPMKRRFVVNDDSTSDSE